MLSTSSHSLIARCAVLACAALLGAPAAASALALEVPGAGSAGLPAGNLIANSGGDADVGATSESGNLDVTGFDPETGAFTVIRYGFGGFPTVAHSESIGGGANFFAGGTSASSTGAQLIDVSGAAALLDAGNVPATLGAHLGGYLFQEDAATLTATFLGAQPGSPELGSLTIGPVTAADRGQQTVLLRREASATVPVGTRAIRVVLTLTRASGSSNDGYADNLSLVLGEVAPTPVPTPAPTPVPTPAPTPAPTSVPLALTLAPYAPVGTPKPVKAPANKPKVTVLSPKPAALPDGGRTVTVSPATACNLTAKSVFTAPTNTAKRAAQTKAGAVKVSGFGTSTLKVGATTVRLPQVKVPAIAPSLPVTIPVRPVTTPPKAASAPRVDPPPVKVTTTVTCTPIVGVVKYPAAAKPSQSCALVGFCPDPFRSVGLATSSARPSTPVRVTTTVNPPAAPPATQARLKSGLWSGKMQGTVAARPGQAVSKGDVSFVVGDNGTISDFRARGAETCYAPAGGQQGGSVTSVPHFTDLVIERPLIPTPTSAFPRLATYDFRASPAPATGTQSVRMVAPLRFTSDSAATGTIDAYRINPLGVANTRCQMSFTFDARPGGSAVPRASLETYIGK